MQAFDDSRDVLVKPQWTISPYWICAIATYVTIPVWFVAFLTLATQGKSINNPAGVGVYFGICLFLGIPVAALNALCIVPIFRRIVGHAAARIVPLSACFGSVLAAEQIYGQHLNDVAVATGVAVSSTWTLAWYLSLFLLPPMYVGALLGCIGPQKAATRSSQTTEDETSSYAEYKNQITNEYSAAKHKQ